MTWLSVLAVVFKLLGPVLVKWLETLLIEAAKEMPGEPHLGSGYFAADLADLFARARGKVRWFQFRRKAALALVEDVVLARSFDVHMNAARVEFWPLAPMTNDERIALRAALAY